MFNLPRNSNPLLRLCLALVLNGSTSDLNKNLNIISQDLVCTRELNAPPQVVSGSCCTFMNPPCTMNRIGQELEISKI